MPKKIVKGFTILELLVVLAIIGVFAVVAFPNIIKWIGDREVRKEVYKTVEFIKERKSEVESGKYGMTQIILNRQLQVATMTPERFFNIYKGFNSPYQTHKNNQTCGFMSTAGFTRQNQYDPEDFGPYASDSSVHIYPSAWHNPMRTVICISKDNSIRYDKPNQNARKRDDETGNWVDIFVFCPKSNSTQLTCKYNSTIDNRYMIEIDRFQNIKIFKYNKNQNKWKKI
jgi:prepilin-type N-terminal cleavage/methylation domain-containing protein